MAGTSAAVLLRICIRRSLAAQRPKEVGDGGAVGAQGLDAADLRREEAALGVDHVELACHAVLVAQAREAQRFVERRLARALRLEALQRALLHDERGAHFAEGRADRLLVLEQGLALARAGRLAPRLQAAAGEDRLGEAGGELPRGGRGAGEEVAERGALAAEEAGEGDGGKHLAARDGDARVRSRERALRVDEVRAAQEKLGGHARRQHRRTGTLVERHLERDLELEYLFRVAAEQHRERRFLALAIALKRRQLRANHGGL